MKPLNIALVDDHNLFRKGLVKLINMGDTQHKYNILFEPCRIWMVLKPLNGCKEHTPP
jgi:DNA-binding NarL/FixJ family response regulator